MKNHRDLSVITTHIGCNEKSRVTPRDTHDIGVGKRRAFGQIRRQVGMHVADRKGFLTGRSVTLGTNSIIEDRPPLCT